MIVAYFATAENMPHTSGVITGPGFKLDLMDMSSIADVQIRSFATREEADDWLRTMRDAIRVTRTHA